MKPKEENVFTRFTFIFKKLCLLGIGFIGMNVSVTYLINERFYDLDWYKPVTIGLLPLITFFIIFVCDQLPSGFTKNMAHYKYIPLLPFVFYNESKPRKSSRINLNEIKLNIEPCDLVLRRYESYVDGIIFSENSYFTHVGIYCSKYKHYDSRVLHAEAQPGVHDSSLNEFCECYDVAVFRFSFDEEKDERTMFEQIAAETRPENDTEHIRRRERTVFRKFFSKAKSNENKNILQEHAPYAEGYSKLILDRATSLIGTKYDFKFNFSDFNQLSCIEYVWYCFKSLYPFHRIKVEDFEFFLGMINMPVIVPDVFIRNDYFKYVYSSIPGVNDKEGLKKHAVSAQNQFWKYVSATLVWDVILLTGWSLL